MTDALRDITRSRAAWLALGALVLAIGWKLSVPPALAPAPNEGRAAPSVPAEPAPEPHERSATPAPKALETATRRPAPLPEPELDTAPPPGPDSIDEATRRAWQRELEREHAAQERFERGREEAQVRARDIDARVRDALQRAVLVPEPLDGGRIRGLRIQSLEGGSPLAEAGFREGDLLVQLDGQPLQDPFDLPALLARAGPELELCAEGPAGAYCRELVLR